MKITCTSTETRDANNNITALSTTYTASATVTLSPPSNVTATVQAGGSLPANTQLTYNVTALTDNGETTPTTVTTTTTATDLTVVISWSTVPGATKYRVYKDTIYFETTTPSYTDDGTGTGTSGTPPTTNTATATFTTTDNSNIPISPAVPSLSTEEKISKIAADLKTKINTIRQALVTVSGKSDAELGTTTIEF